MHAVANDFLSVAAARYVGEHLRRRIHRSLLNLGEGWQAFGELSDVLHSLRGSHHWPAQLFTENT